MSLYRLLGILLTICCLAWLSYIYSCMPAENQFRIGADEGTYYRQAATVLKNGKEGFRLLAERYLNNPIEQESPHPLRTGHIWGSAFMLSLNDSISTLAIKSLIFFGLLLVLSGLYVRRLFGLESAFIVVVVMAASPLISAMAKRALLDSETLFFAAFSLFAFLDYLRNPTTKRFILFLVVTSLSCCLKETALLILPFYAITIVLARFLGKDDEIGWPRVLMAIFLPVMVAGLLHWWSFGDFGLVAELVDTILHSSSSYMEKWGAGPWQQYLMDFILLAPVTTLLAFFFVGNRLVRGCYEKTELLLMALLIYLLVIYGFIPKNIRFLLLFEFVLRIMAGLYVATIGLKLIQKSEWLKRGGMVALLVLVCLEGYSNFNLFFVQFDIYDPIGYNLQYAANIVPNGSVSEPKSPIATKLSSQTKMLTDSLIEVSLKRYSEGEYEGCIEECVKVIELDPLNATAYNNMCSAFNQLSEFEKAKEACERALQVNPNYGLAKSNLNYALQQLSSSTGSR